MNILIADDHSLFRKALKQLLDQSDQITNVLEASSGVELLDIVQKQKIHLVILDIKMPDLDGYEAAKILADKFPLVKVLVVTMYDERSLIRSLIEIGIDGYMLKNDHNLLYAIEMIAAGKSYFSSHLSKAFEKDHTLVGSNLLGLNKQERKILRLLARGKNSQEIAEELLLAKSTIETYRKAILKRYSLSNSSQLVDLAHRCGLL